MKSTKKGVLRFYELVHHIGRDAALKLHALYGGKIIYFVPVKTLLKDSRDKDIYAAYKKHGEEIIDKLAYEHDLQPRWVRTIIEKEKAKEDADS